jgi:carboxylesterase
LQLKKLIKNNRTALDQITIPILLIHSKADKGVPIKNINKLYRHISSKNKRRVIFEKSGHVVTEDIEKDRAFNEIYEFIKQNII